MHQQQAEHFNIREAALSRLRGPIGIYIGSKTPPEIAVSVIAEVLAVKNGVVLPRHMEVAQSNNERAVAGNDAGDLVWGWRVLRIEARIPLDLMSNRPLAPYLMGASSYQKKSNFLTG